LAEHDWLGDDVWFAHLVKLDAEEIGLLGATRTGIAHCPQSNGRLGSGIAPRARWRTRARSYRSGSTARRRTRRPT
jgi:cytosine/adenosine deaminase-related metal-dependent hydrolase